MFAEVDIGSQYFHRDVVRPVDLLFLRDLIAFSTSALVGGSQLISSSWFELVAVLEISLGEAY